MVPMCFGRYPAKLYTTQRDETPPRAFLALLLCFLQAQLVFASAYNGRPKMVVVVVIDQFRADYLERYRDQFGEGGFKLFLDHGAYFTNCHYNYVNTHTAPGHCHTFDRYVSQRPWHYGQPVVGPEAK